VAIASLETGKIERTIPMASEPSLVRFRVPDGKTVMAGSYNGRSVTVLDTASGRTVVTLPLPVAPKRFCMKNDGGELFITGDGMDAVVIMFPYTTEIDQSILAGHAPDAMAVTGDDISPGYLLAANPASDTVTAMDVTTRRVVCVVRVGKGPREILFTPDGQYALVLNEGSGDVAVIRRTTLAEAWVRRYKSGPLFTSVAVGEKPVSAAIVQVG
jgi:YVTN family beta-propeller protein